jgi:hypothetical protein
MVRYRFKKKATKGDIARISSLLLSVSSIAFLFSDFILRDFDLSFWFVILFLENMVMTSYFAFKGSLVDFTGAPRLPKSWLLSTFVEEGEDQMR